MAKYTFEFWAIPKDIASDPKLTAIDKQVLSYMVTLINGENVQLKVKQSTIAKAWGCTKLSVLNSVKRLTKLGYISKNRPGNTLCNRYEIRK